MRPLSANHRAPHSDPYLLKNVNKDNCHFSSSCIIIVTAFITMELDDYQCLKLAYLITPSYFNIFQLELAIGSDNISIEQMLDNLK